MIETGWISILPPLIAIALALITKEVYSALFLGLLSGMIIYVVAAKEPFVAIFSHLFDMMATKIADNSYMIIFLALLWAVITLIGKSGGTAAYGRWAERKLKSRRATRMATALLGVLIFIDDGFNCLTIGTVMRPVYDRQRISREKLAYIIDATAAPVCIIAPVSSWAVAVASEVSDVNGFHVFLSTIPYNLYALLTILMVVFVCVTGLDFGKMKTAEQRALREGNGEAAGDTGKTQEQGKGKVMDLVAPILVLIVCAILGMAYVGGFFHGVPFSEAIGENPTAGLSLGAFAGLVTAFVLYIPRRIVGPKEFVESIVGGISSIVPPMLILILSWSLGGVCREMIGTGQFISGFVSSANLPLQLLPFLVFVIAAVVLGHLWHADSYRHDHLLGEQRQRHSDSDTWGNAGRFCVWRPLFSDIRYHDPRIHRCTVSAHPACRNANSLRHAGCGGMCRWISDYRLHAYTVDWIGDRLDPVDRIAAYPKQEDDGSLNPR